MAVRGVLGLQGRVVRGGPHPGYVAGALAGDGDDRVRRQEGPAASPVERDYFALACAKVQDGFGLTAREMDVLGLLARGRTSAYIQKALSISDGTARTHISHIYKKLGVKSQQALLDVVEETMADLAGEATLT